ncbi:hypothetical protein [Thiosocius teredinicola]|uniref:hypothetical protein n=1 Tax=Thiosocius teredinicola TaxID=1973002 RepID=UPI000991342D
MNRYEVEQLLNSWGADMPEVITKHLDASAELGLHPWVRRNALEHVLHEARVVGFASPFGTGVLKVAGCDTSYLNQAKQDTNRSSCRTNAHFENAPNFIQVVSKEERRYVFG